MIYQIKGFAKIHENDSSSTSSNTIGMQPELNQTNNRVYCARLRYRTELSVIYPLQYGVFDVSLYHEILRHFRKYWLERYWSQVLINALNWKDSTYVRLKLELWLSGPI